MLNDSETELLLSLLRKHGILAIVDELDTHCSETCDMIKAGRMLLDNAAQSSCQCEDHEKLRGEGKAPTSDDKMCRCGEVLHPGYACADQFR